jgi:putative transposase
VQRQHTAHHLIDAYRISARQACRVIGLPRAKALGRDDTVLSALARARASARALW